MTEKILVVSTRKRVERISYGDIVYLEKNLRKIIVHTDDGSISFYGKFDEIKPFLDDRFFKCHRSYIISLPRVKAMEAEEIFFDNGESITISRDLYRNAKNKFLDYFDNVIK